MIQQSDFDNLQSTVTALQTRLLALEQKEAQDILQHVHTGTSASRVSLSNLIELFETVSVAPTGIPTGPWDQIKIYVTGVTYRLYWYDSPGATWHYVTATA